jgi:hypothetical protein
MPRLAPVTIMTLDAIATGWKAVEIFFGPSRDDDGRLEEGRAQSQWQPNPATNSRDWPCLAAASGSRREGTSDAASIIL